MQVVVYRGGVGESGRSLSRSSNQALADPHLLTIDIHLAMVRMVMMMMMRMVMMMKMVMMIKVVAAKMSILMVILPK